MLARSSISCHVPLLKAAEVRDRLVAVNSIVLTLFDANLWIVLHLLLNQEVLQVNCQFAVRLADT